MKKMSDYDETIEAMAAYRGVAGDTTNLGRMLGSAITLLKQYREELISCEEFFIESDFHVAAKQVRKTLEGSHDSS